MNENNNTYHRLDIDNLETTSVDISKVNNVVKIMLLKKLHR